MHPRTHGWRWLRYGRLVIGHDDWPHTPITVLHTLRFGWWTGYVYQPLTADGRWHWRVSRRKMPRPAKQPS